MNNSFDSVSLGAWPQNGLFMGTGPAIIPKNWGIRSWIDTYGRLMIADPERLRDKKQNTPDFILPVGDTAILFRHVATLEGERVFQAIALLPAHSERLSQAALWSQTLGLRTEGI